jgi:hypothetical protein
MTYTQKDLTDRINELVTMRRALLSNHDFANWTKEENNCFYSIQGQLEYLEGLVS